MVIDSLVDMACDLASRLVRRTPLLQRTSPAVILSGVVSSEAILAHPFAGLVHLAPILLQGLPSGQVYASTSGS